ncbi:Na-translocating system protein MpsC family protein [Halobacillus sp. Marseille-Q1614]|uniref:Na-translocating system protein MpsC family protein n=1 Tax=Halobacillus sp. Marseille-Q1614 TaxID=2709134 RepID=UPI00156E7936|nr:Na-translocating system protein MpsC family protein [Halobacillus sp. Marseille-Q1614]
MENKSIQAEIASYIGKLFRDNFGKGPSSVYVSLRQPYFTIYLSDFLAPMERVLVGQKNYMKVEETRDLLMRELLPDIKAAFSIKTDMEVQNLYYDWSLPNRSGIIIGKFKSENTDSHEVLASADAPNKEAVLKEVVRVSEIAEKVPEFVDSIYLNERTLLIVREGILVRIEKELIKSGFAEQLRLTKRNLEKSLLNQEIFGEILGIHVQDVFVDWDFELDKSYIVLILKPK